MSEVQGFDGVSDVLETEPRAQRVGRTADGRLVVQARAKLNLGLRVFPVRPDGFHAIESWMVPISWHDTVFVAGEGGPLELVVTGRSQGVPVELEKNLVGRAALALAKAGGIEPRGRIELHKVLPPGGGLGGGSSDAANALVALNEAWGLGMSEEKLAEIAAGLGSDVPFFVNGRPSLCTGRGEVMTPLRNAQPLFAVLIVSPGGCPTGAVYQAFDAGHQAEHVWTADTWCRYAAASADELNTVLMNDLETAAFHVAPWLKGVKEKAIVASNGRAVHMTGSGSTLFTMCGSGAEAGELQGLWARELGPDYGVVAVKILRQR
jgi:4-diphosphocytidyl-2-C-methyl-D-erythritol kinase